MEFISLKPFVPSGSNFESTKNFFQELGFQLLWTDGNYADFENGTCKFILQRFDNKTFAENFMVSVGIKNADEFWQQINDKNLVEKYGIRLSKPCNQPYGREVNIIDAAGVCWHFVEATN